MISSIRAVRAAVLLVSCAALVTGCGDQFRPTINFVPSPVGNPVGPANAVFLSTNPAGVGSDTHIDVGGDSAVGIVNIGAAPVFLGKGGPRAFVLSGDNTVTLYTAIILPTATTTLLPVTTQVALPSTTSGAIGGAASSNGNIYIAHQGPCTTTPPSTDGCVSVIPSTQNVVSQVVPAGIQPVMVAANTAGSQAYVINHGDNTVTIIGTQDNAVVGTIAVGSQPIWGVMSSDGVDVFVVNQGDGTLSVIDTTLNIVFTTINLDPNAAGPNPALGSNYAFYDNTNRRVYVTNPGDHSVTIIKADSIDLGANPQILPTVLAKVPVSGSPISVGAIADGTRAYAALGNCPAGTNHTNLLTNLSKCTGNQVSVINISSLSESKLIPVGTGPVWLDVSSDGTKVYTANAIDQNMSVIKTSTDTEVVRMSAPQQSLGCVNPSCGVTGNQTPFMVVTFP